MDNAFRESEDTFRQLSENITDAFWIRSPDMRTVHYVSPAFERIWGRPVSFLYSNPARWVDLIHPADRDRVTGAFAGLVGDAPSLELEYRIVRPDGDIRWVHVRGFQIRDGQAILRRHAGIVTDITERKHAEFEIARSHRALKMLSHCNEMVIRARDESDLLDRICCIAVEDGGYEGAWVRYVQPGASGGTTIAARAGLDTGQLSVIVLPLRDGDHLFGQLELSSPPGHRRTPADLALLQGMADNVAFGIASLRAQVEARRLQDAVVSVAAGVSGATGTAFFEQLARNMAGALEAEAAVVARLLPGEPAVARAIAVVVDGGAAGEFDFAVEGTPCERLLAEDVSAVTGPAAGAFPGTPLLAGVAAQSCVGHRLTSSSGQPLGLLFVLFRSPLQRVEFTTSTLRIFATRAAAELERQETDAQVREQAALLDVAHDAIVVKDLDGRILYWNKGAERLYGWTSAEVAGRPSVDVLCDEPARFDLARSILMEGGKWQGEVACRSKAGAEVIVEARWTLVRDAGGAPASILAINTDVTEKKKLESQFLRAQRMEGIGTLAGGIAHDLNNVLAPIRMSIEMLMSAVSSDEDLSTLATLDMSARRGAELVGQVLSYARGVEGHRIPVNPRHVMRDLLQVIRDTFSKSIDVQFTPSARLWLVLGDASQLHQVFLNLCVNARDAMPDGGTLAIGMRNVVIGPDDEPPCPESRPGAYVLVEVADNGAGIPAEARDRIFEPFFTTREIGKGTGLGLSTTQAIVQSHNGFIVLTSDVGVGTTFRVYLPAAGTEAAADEAAAEPAGPILGSGELVLVVDDEPAIRTVAERMLQRFGYRVATASHGGEALEVYAARGDEVAVVLTDMAMPVMDGPALISALRGIDPGVRIVGTSGLHRPDSAAPAPDQFVPKPYDARTILKVLHEVIHRPG